MGDGQIGVNLVIVVLLVEPAHTQGHESVTTHPHLVEARLVLGIRQKPKIASFNYVLVCFME